MIFTHRPGRTRPGATILESTLIFLVLFTLVLGMFDLGMAVMQMHILNDAARQLARQARVRGKLADVLGPWGPAPVGPLPASDSHEACAILRQSLPGFDPETVTLQMEWTGGDNAEGMRVRVSLTAVHCMIVPPLLGGRTSLNLQAVSVTPISH